MTIEEAFEEIGLSPGAPAGEIRRSYLRKLKTRKPEVDPEGFRRLREAYDLLTENAGFLSMRGTAPPAEPAQEPPPPPRPLEPSPVVDIQRKLAQIDHPEERLAVLRRAVREHPREEPLRWWLLRELEDCGLQEEALELLLSSDRAGLGGFLEHLASRYPDALTEDDLERLEASGNPEELTVAAEAWLVRGSPERAVETLFRAMAIADAADDPTTPEPGRIVAFLLYLQGEGDREEAERLQERFRERLRGAGREVDLLDPQAAALWRIAQEIALLSPGFPDAIRTAIARAVANGSPEQAVSMIHWLIQGDPLAAWQAAPEIRKLPALEEMYGELFADLPLPVAEVAGPVLAESSGWARERSFLQGCLLPAALVSFLLLFVGYMADDPPPHPRDPQRLRDARYSPSERLELGSIDETMQAICGGEGPVLPEVIAICGTAREVVGHLRAGDCYKAMMAQMRLRAAVAKTHSPLMDALVEAIRTEGAPVCNAL